MKHIFAGKVLRTIRKYKLLDKGDSIVIGVSGGPDSVALFHALYELKRMYSLNIIVAHLNHLLRGEDSLKDERYVVKLAKKFNVPVIMKKTDVLKFSKEQHVTVEEAGRIARYNMFNRIAKDLKVDKIALAHHFDDQAETVLMRIIRGTGISGFGGIFPVREHKGLTVIRPLLECSKKEILNYLKLKKIKAREDKTNISEIYFRNRIRNELLPILEKKYNLQIRSHLVKFAEIARYQQDFIDKIADNISERVFEPEPEIAGSTELIKDKIAYSHPAIQYSIIRKAVLLTGCDLAKFNFEHIDAILKLVESPEGNKELHLPENMTVVKRYNKLIFIKDRCDILKKKEYKYSLSEKGKTELRELGIKLKIEEFNKKIRIKKSSKIAYFDKSGVSFPLFVRNRRIGDKFSPFGLGGKFKKLKDFFIDEKIPIEIRDTVPLLVDSKDRILWVAGYRADDRFKITAKTGHIIKCSIVQ